MSKYSMYNGVWYDGQEAGIIKFILSSDEIEARVDLHEFLVSNGFSLDVVKLDRLYEVSLTEIMGIKENGTDDGKRAVKYFTQIYFGERGV